MPRKKSSPQEDVAKTPDLGKILGLLSADHVITEDSNDAKSLYLQNRFGSEVTGSHKVLLSLLEALFLIENGRLEVLDGRNKTVSPDGFLRKAMRLDKNFWIRYSVFKDLRSRGYIVKTALKFGADFRVYDRGVKPGEDHAKWIVYPVHEGKTMTWYEFSAKTRVAHSTKKRLLLGIVDDEADVTYYEVKWMRP